jgi:PAS domain S-box-containing protein
MLALVLLGSAVLAARYYASVKADLTAGVVAHRLTLAQLAAATLSERLDRMTDVAASLGSRVRFAELVTAGNWDAALVVLRDVPGEFPFVERLFLSDPRGTLMADIPELPGSRGENFASRDWYQGVMRERKPYVSSVYRRKAEPQINVVAVSTPIRDRASGKVTGILVLQLSLDLYFDWAKALQLDHEAVLTVVDRRAQAAYATGAPLQGAILDRSTNPGVRWLKQRRAGAEVEIVDGVETLYVSVPAKHGWGVVIEQPVAIGFAARDLQLVFVQIAYGLAVLLLAAVAWLGMAVGKERRRAEIERVRGTLATHAERLRVLHGIDQAVIAGESPDAIAAAVIQPLRDLLGVPRAIVNKFDLEAGEVEWVAASGRRRTRVGPGVRYSIKLMGDIQALKRGEAQVIDTRKLPPGPDADALLASGVDRYMVVPMIAGGELIGALSFGGRATTFSPEQMHVAQEVAAQLSIAITMARLMSTVRQHAAELESRVRERTASLAAANHELEDLYNRAPCGYHSVDGKGLIVRMNDTWLSWLGYSREEVVGRMHHADLMTPTSAERFWKEAFPAFRRQGWLKNTEFEYRRKDGSTFVASLNATSVHDEGGRYLMSRSTVFDISERKLAEETVRALNKELEGFSYSVSHDLRAPLRAVDGYARMLEEDYAGRLDDEGRRLLGVIRDSAGRMGQLIDDLLAFSRLGRQPMARRAVDVAGLVREAIDEVRGAHRASVDLRELPAAHGDRALLKQVWVNLIGNAFKYSAKREAARIEIGGHVEGEENVYWVRDNGAGFDMRYAAKLFGVFQRLHSQDDFSGTGVGLAIVQRVVTRHGGRVWAEGAPDAGASFFFSLPQGK